MSSLLIVLMQVCCYLEIIYIDCFVIVDMLVMLYQDDKQILEVVGVCLLDIVWLIDIVIVMISWGGCLVIIGVGVLGWMIIEVVSDYLLEGKYVLVGLIVGGQMVVMVEWEIVVNNYDLGVFELQLLDFSNCDMLLVLIVSGKMLWVWGVMCYVWLLGVLIVVIIQQLISEVVQLVDIIIVLQIGLEVVVGLVNLKVQLVQRQIVNMLIIGFVICDGWVYSNLWVDVQVDNLYWVEWQIVIVMVVIDCMCSEVKVVLVSCYQYCCIVILMLFSGFDVWYVWELLIKYYDYLCFVLCEVQCSVVIFVQ